MTDSHASIVLIGMTGAGKSATGLALAELLNLPFVETDALVEEAAGMSIAELVSAQGEAPFRELESAALQKALTTTEQEQIVSTGGGIVLSQENRDLICARARSVYLSVPLYILQERLQNETESRPLLAGQDLATVLADMLRDREKLYQAAAYLSVLQMREDKPVDVAKKICAGLRHMKEEIWRQDVTEISRAQTKKKKRKKARAQT